MATLAEQLQVPADSLLAVARQHGTPAYAYDLRRLRAQIARLRENLPPDVDILYSLKANPSLGLCGVIARAGLGADVASAGELATALEAGFSPERIHVSGPYKSPELLSLLLSLPAGPGPLLSVDSPGELAALSQISPSSCGQRVLLRLRPDFESSAAVSAGRDSRFGVPFEELPRCAEVLASFVIRHSSSVIRHSSRITRDASLVTHHSSPPPLAGFHVFCGSQVLEAAGVVRHFRAAADLCRRAADLLGFAPQVLDLGGGFGVPYGPGEPELELRPIADELARLSEQLSPARIVVELGRYIVAQCGWYLTAVAGHQSYDGRRAVVVDGGTHQRSDACCLDLCRRAAPPHVLKMDHGPSDHRLSSADYRPSSIVHRPSSADYRPSSGHPRSGSIHRPSSIAPTHILGCLSLPADVLAEAAPLPPLAPGDVLAFANAGAYGLAASPLHFHGSPAPAEVVFDGARLEAIRARQTARGVLDGQRRAVDLETLDSGTWSEELR